MGHPKGQLLLSLQLPQHMGQVLPLQHKPNLPLHTAGVTAGIALHGRFKILKPACRVVEIYDCLVQGLCRIIRQHSLEMPESNCTLVEIFFVLHLVITACALDEQIRSPVITGTVQIIRPSVPGMDNVQGLPVGISAVCQNLLPEPGCDTHNILHQLHRFVENTLIHPLEDISPPALLRLKYQTEGIIYMSAAVWNLLHQLSRKCKVLNYLSAYQFLAAHLLFLPKFLRIEAAFF